MASSGDRPRIKNDLLVRAARGERTPRAPVWAMRQAGRYLPEFRELRVDHDFFKVCQTPALAAEVTLQPLRRYEGLLDAVVIFSDILIVPQAMGLECLMIPGKGPSFPEPLREPADLETRLVLAPPQSTYSYLFEAIRVTRERMDDAVPVVGFAGGPWTLLAYMVDGGGSKTFADSKRWLYAHPEASHRLLAALTSTIVDLLVGQYEAGASVLQVFESSAGELSPALFDEFSLPYLRNIAKGVRARVPPVADGGPPLIIFARGAHFAIESLDRTTDYDVIGLDWTMDPAATCARAATRRVAFQGNLDPGALYGTTESIRAATRAMLEGFGDRAVIANLGWGMQPSHDPERLGDFFAAVHEESARLRLSDK